MSKDELEHLSLLHHKLLESPILCVSIGMEVTGKCEYILLMFKVHLLHIKGYGIKTLEMHWHNRTK